MRYIEQIMGDSEQVVYQTHQHVVVLLQRTIGWFFAFVVFLGLGLVMLLTVQNQQGDKVRWTIGLIALCSLVMPVYLIASAWVRDEGRRSFVGRIWRPAVVGVVILIVALVIMFRPDLRAMGWIGMALALIALVEVIRGVLDWLNERYIITNRRVMEIRGIVNKHVRDSALEKVNDVDLRQSIFGRMLGYGTVQIITGSDIGVNMFRRIANPVRFKRAMLNAKEELHAPAAASEPEAVVSDRAIPKADIAADEPISPPPADIPDLILELDDLRQRGILSEEEFEAKKKKLLDQL